MLKAHDEAHNQSTFNFDQKHRAGAARTTQEVFARSHSDQIKLLMWRGFTLQKRDYVPLIQRGVAHLAVGLIMGLLFFNLGHSQTDSTALFGLVFFLVARNAFDALASIPVAFLERPYISRQRAACYYQMFSYAVATILTDAPGLVLQVIIFSLPVYFLSGLRRTAGHYFFALLILVIENQMFSVFARVISAITPDPMMASLLASTFSVITMIYR